MIGYITTCFPRDDDAFSTIGIVAIAEILLILFGIFFLQSGIDKIIDRKGKLASMRGLFGNNSLSKTAPILLTLLTILNISVGAMAILSQFSILLQIYPLRFMPITTGLSACFLLLSLFILQRIGKEFKCAAKTGRYLLVAILGLIFIWGTFLEYAPLHPLNP